MEGEEIEGGEIGWLIGMCKVPLDSIAAGTTMHAKYPITKIDASHIVTGSLEVRIDVIAAEGQALDSRIFDAASALIFTDQFERQIIQQ